MNRRLIKQTTILIILLFQILPITAQESNRYIADIEQYSVKKGLLHRNVSDIHQDSRGFIWLVTKYGLSRFDGKQFQPFTKEKNGLPSSYVRSMTEDKNGWLWVFSDDDSKAFTDFTTPIHLTLINVYSLEVKSVETHLSEQLPFEIPKISQIEFEDDGTIIFMTFDNVYYEYHPKNGFKKNETPTLTPFVITEKNTILGVTKDFHYKEIDRKGRVIRKHRFPGTINPEAFFQDIRILKNAQQNGEYLFYSFSNESANILFSSSDAEPLSPIILPKSINLQRKSYKGNLFYDKPKDWFWFCERDTFFVFSINNGLIYDFKNHPILSKSYINDVIFTDKIAWVATSNGLFKIKLTQTPFVSYLKTPKNASETTNACRGIITINDTLYVNISDDKKPHFIDLKTGETGKMIFPESKIDLSYPQVLYKDQKDNLWFTAYDAVKYNLQTKTTTDYIKNQAIFSSFWSIYEEKNGTLWFGGDKGIGSLDEYQDSIKIFTAKPPFEALNKQTVYQFMELSPDRIMLATVGGFYELNPSKNKIIKRYWTGGKEDEYFPYDQIYHFYKDKEGVFWVATDGNGLIRWEQKEGKNIYENFTVADGLSSNTIYAVYEDEANNLWMPSDYGIIRFNKLSHNAIAYLPEDGITVEEFNRISHYQAPDGKLYFGSVNGVTAFYPSDLADTTSTSNIPFEIVELLQYSAEADKIVDKTISLLQSKVITLQPGERFFDLKFALLNFENTDLIRYSYRIKGIDKEWNFTPENNIRISGLPYGNHQLTIRGQSPNGQFSTNEIQITIHVLRPFYMRWWFLLFCLSAIIVSAYVWYRWRTQQLINYQNELENEVKTRTVQIEKQAEELKDLDKLKSTFFANISHELRTPLTLMLAPIDTALKGQQLKNREQGLLNIAKQNGKQLLKLINSILDLTKLEVNKYKLELKPLALFPFIKRITATFESYAESRNIKLVLDYQANTSLNIQTDREKLETIFNNLLSNAIKYTPPNGRVNLLIKNTIDTIFIEISDTGRGIHSEDLPHIFDRFYQTKQPNATAEGGTGIGLALVKELVNLFEGKIEVESKLNKGTTLTMVFPRIDAVNEAGEEAEFVETPQNQEAYTNPISLNQITQHNILIVEDNVTLRDFIQSLLSVHKTRTAGNGQEALEAIEQQQPDLIISDVMMPYMDGFELLETLKSNARLRHIPTLMLTARASMDDKLKALRIGVDDYMTKPFEQDELYARVNNLLRNATERLKWIQEVEPEMDDTSTEKQIKKIATPTISNTDKQWLEELESIVENELTDINFSTNNLAKKLALSRSQLFRKIKKLTGLSPSQYLQESRLKKAYELFENKRYDSVKAVAFSVGFKHRNSFTTQFKARFGRLPSELL